VKFRAEGREERSIYNGELTLATHEFEDEEIKAVPDW
jgi:hypothetical protein